MSGPPSTGLIGVTITGSARASRSGTVSPAVSRLVRPVTAKRLGAMRHPANAPA